jgi:membrane-bound metal-dependent hydrolase YbcI (DUF457 family)
MASPVGHLAFGLAAAAVAARAAGTPDSAALWIGAAVACGIPDVDVVFPLLGLSRRFHRNGTHSLLFAGLVIAAGLVVMGALDLRPAIGLQVVWIAALLSHYLLDVITTGPTLGRLGWGIPLLWPVSRTRFWVAHPFMVGDRAESQKLADTLREMGEDMVRLVPPCAGVFLLARLWPWG